MVDDLGQTRCFIDTVDCISILNAGMKRTLAIISNTYDCCDDRAVIADIRVVAYDFLDAVRICTSLVIDERFKHSLAVHIATPLTY